jgi:hypothetical protein
MIKFINEDVLLEIKSNRQLLYHNVIASKKQTLEEAFHNDKIIRDTSAPGDDFVLDMSHEKPELTDFENVKRVHKNMRSLSESQASDERIWAAYTLSVFADYMRYRWNPDSEIAMMNRYFFSYSPKRSLFRNGIARLWWIGHLTYDATRPGDKYELTEYVCRKQDNINLLLDINFGNNPAIVSAVIQALIDAEKGGMTIDRDKIRKISEYINTLGGLYLVDAFSYDMIYDKCTAKLKKMN